MPYIGPQTATLGAVAGTVTSVTLFADVASANGRYIYNSSTAPCFLAFGTIATVSAYTTQIAANTGFSFPIPTYAGPVTAIWNATNGSAITTAW